MIVLRAIGRFFARIGRWIRDTAWVQPLLIVGGIFAIIFSIPYITNWVKSWFEGSNEADSYFERFKLSLDGAKDQKSEADELFKYALGDYENDTQKQSEYEKRFGKKFFVAIVEKGCAGCETAYKGFETLQNKWNTGDFQTNDSFKLFTIYADTTDSDDNTINLFKKYFYGTYYDQYFEEVCSSMTQSAYYKNKGGDSSSYATELETLIDEDKWAAPVFMYFDFEANLPQSDNQLRVTEVLFSVDGKDDKTDSIAKARTLFDCWNHADIFSKDYEKKN